MREKLKKIRPVLLLLALLAMLFCTVSCDNKIPMKKFNVTFDANLPQDGTVANMPSGQTVYEAGLAYEPSEKPSLPGYLFMHWYSGTDDRFHYNFNQPVTDDLVLHAKWVPAVTVTFDGYGSQPDGTPTGVPDPITIQTNTPVTEPALDPGLKGYVFDGWYKDLSDTASYDFSQSVPSNFILHAKWAPAVTITFYENKPNGATGLLTDMPDPIIVKENTPATKPDEPKLTGGYAFDEWITDPDDETTVYDFSQPVTHNIDLYAKWVPSATIIFDTPAGPGSDINLLQGAPGKEAILPLIYETGMDFMGWYEQPDFSGDPIPIHTTFPTDGVTYYAKIDTPNTDLDYSGEGDLGVKMKSEATADMIHIPYTHDGKFVKSIRDSAFKDKKLTSVFIPDTLMWIYSSAFESCTGLTNITIPAGVTYLDRSIFTNCPDLKNVTILGKITTIDYKTFYDCKNLESITLPNSLETIGSFVFARCNNLKSITIPNSVTSINYTAFSNCLQNNLVITIKKNQGSISEAPWGAAHAKVNWEPTT